MPIRPHAVVVLVALVLAAAGCGNVASTLPDAAAASDDASPLADAAPGGDDASTLPDAGPGTPDADPCTTCESGLCTDGVCQTTQLVPCGDVAPPNATSTIADVTIQYIAGSGWTAPAACAWSCDAGFCQIDATCADATVTGYVPPPGSSRWFGGDDRDLDHDGDPDIRSVGGGQTFKIDAPVTVAAVELAFSNAFRSAATGTPHPTGVAVDVRDANGNVLKSASQIVPATFTGGWISWNMSVTLQPGLYVLTAYVPGVFSGENYSNGIVLDFNAGNPDGTAYHKERTTAGSMQAWTGWSVDTTADHAFRIVGACL
jgi:hypothetical protein